MTARDSQNSSYINKMRALATALLNADDTQADYATAWNAFFGGESQLLETDFVGDNEGLDKEDMANLIGVFAGFHTWLDEAGLSRRVYLQKVRIV